MFLLPFLGFRAVMLSIRLLLLLLWALGFRVNVEHHAPSGIFKVGRNVEHEAPAASSLGLRALMLSIRLLLLVARVWV